MVSFASVNDSPIRFSLFTPNLILLSVIIFVVNSLSANVLVIVHVPITSDLAVSSYIKRDDLASYATKSYVDTAVTEVATGGEVVLDSCF